MEKLMQYVWQHRLWPHHHMRTVDDVPIQVIDPGRLNTDAGPDFFNAKVKIGGRLWAGDIEIHVKASDWHRHNHDGDPAYESVILHVVDRDDARICRANGEVIPQLCMPCSPTLNRDFSALVDRADIDLPCAATIAEMKGLYLTDWLSALTFERLHAKSDRIEQIKKQTMGDVREACYVVLARSLGFGINSEPFERLARSLPLRFIARHRDSLTAVEALLFGQSGLLGVHGTTDPYPAHLAREYSFLASKFGLHPLESVGWKMGRMRPANFPHRRIAYLAKMLHESTDGLHSRILDIDSLESARALFSTTLTGYWTNHFHFTDSPTSRIAAGISSSSVDRLIINVAAPVLFNHGVTRGDESFITRAIDLLEEIAPERNSIVEMFGRCGIKATDAADSQALIHLRRNFCETRKCLYCRIGHHHLASKARRTTAN